MYRMRKCLQTSKQTSSEPQSREHLLIRWKQLLPRHLLSLLMNLMRMRMWIGWPTWTELTQCSFIPGARSLVKPPSSVQKRHGRTVLAGTLLTGFSKKHSSSEPQSREHILLRRKRVPCPAIRPSQNRSLRTTCLMKGHSTKPPKENLTPGRQGPGPGLGRSPGWGPYGPIGP